MQERRNQTRSRIDKCAILKLDNAAESAIWLTPKVSKDLFCQILDINCQGAQVVLSSKLPNDVLLKMQLKAKENCIIEAKVWLAWHKLINGSNHYGFFFSEIKDMEKEKIKKLIDDVYSQKYPEAPPSGEKTKGGEAMNDYRIFERFKKEFSARFILDGKEGTAQTIDVSAKGLGLETNQQLESQAPLEIWLDVPGSTDPLYTRGQVVWSKRTGQRFCSGIELERADLMGISRLLRV